MHGWGRVNPSTKAGVPDENEFTADLQSQARQSLLNEFSARSRYALVHHYQRPKTVKTIFA